MPLIVAPGKAQPSTPPRADTQAPSAPQHLHATSKTDTSISLAWDAATDNIAVAGYELYVGTTRTLTTTATTATRSGWQPNTSYTFAVTAYDAAGNISAKSAPITVTTNSQQPIEDLRAPSTPRNLRVLTKTHGTIELEWDASTDDVGVAQYEVVAGDNWFGTTATPALHIAGLSAATEYPLQIYAADAAGNYSDPSEPLTVTTELPPAPADIAPATDPTVVGDLASDTAFLYSGPDPIQIGVAPGTLVPEQISILRGRVIDRDGQPLDGVQISVLNHPEYGQTASRADGSFDLAINGGSTTLNYAKPGFLPAQRQVDAPWHDYTVLPEVALVPLDIAVTPITLGQDSPAQIAAGSVVSDTAGARQALLLFPAGITATLEFAGGWQEPLTTLHVRATEYTVGEHGPSAMPGTLPPNSGYTYAVEYSVDEAMVPDAQQVRFSQPVIAYVNNFLHFPVGEAVPAGYYDREQAAWIAAESGRIIKIVGVTDGHADLDLDGDGTADDALAEQITDAERAQLAGRYSIGQELWRVPTPHFTPWDFNWPFSPPDDAIRPNGEQPFADKPEDNPCTRAGSIIECQNQTLGEAIDITGTPFQLRYTSERVPDHSASGTLQIPLSGESIPSSVKRIELDIAVAGQLIHKTFDNADDLMYPFIWDRKDAYGRLAQGWHDIVTKIGYVYDGVYQKTERFGYFGGGTIDGDRTRQEVTLTQTWHNQVGVFDLESRRIGGWSIDVQHTYDPNGKVIYLGSGGRQSGQFVGSITKLAAPSYIPTGVTVGPNNRLYYADRIQNTVSYLDPSTDPLWPYNQVIVAGRGGYAQPGFSGDNGPATSAKLSGPSDVAFGKDGSLYIADRDNNRIRRVDKRGIITTFAGNGIRPPLPFVNGSIATDVSICDPVAVAVGADGSVYVASNACSQIYRIGTDGRISTIAGNHTHDLFGDNGKAINAHLNHPTDIALGPDGSLYIADTDNHRIRRIAPTGIITTVAGSGPIGRLNGRSEGDGELATNARLNQPIGVDVQPDGSFYVAEYRRVRWISADRRISTVMGNAGVNSQFVDQGLPPARVRIADLGGLAVGPDGRLHLSVQYPSSSIQPYARILEVRPVLPGFTARDIALPSADGSQIYQFDAVGRHLRTLDTLTGVPLYTFAYDAKGRLISITDRDGLVTTIKRDTNGTATSIVAPYGQHTTLSINGANHLAAVTNPAGETTSFSYSAGGLLTSLIDPRGGRHSFTYDQAGRLVRDTNPVGGFTALQRSDHSHGYSVTLSNALGDTSSVGVEHLPAGGQQNVSVAPNGTTTYSYTKPDGSQVSIDAQGNTTTIVESPDPRWGMQAPFVTSIIMRSPSGQVYFTQTASRQVTLANPNDLLSLRTQIDTVTTNGRTTITAYNGDSRTITTTAPTGIQTVRALDARGRVIHEQTTNLASRDYVYDAYGRLTSVSESDGAQTRTTRLAYNAAGELASSTDPLGATTMFQYDAVGRIVRQTLPTGQVLTFTYDAAGNRTSSTDAQGLRTSYEYDLQNRLTAIVRDPGGRAVRSEYHYDLADNLLRQVDDAGAGRLNITTSYTYTPIGSTKYAISSVTNALGQTTQLEYSLSGELQRTTDPLGHTTVMTYTPQGRLAEITTPGGHTTRTAYDNEGRPTSVTDPRGSTTTSSYDQFGRLKTVVVGTADVEGHPAPNQTTTYDYDLNGRLVGVTDTLGHITTRSYDSFGRPAAITDALGNRTTFGYDAMDRLVRQTIAANDSPTSQTTTYDYDQVGRPLAIHVDPNGLNLTTQYHYVRAGSADSWSLQEVIDPRGSKTAFHYNSLGQRDQTIDALGQVWRFDYDNLNRLVRQTDPLGHATTYTSDALGRPISLTEDGRTQHWSYNADGTLASATDFAGRTTTFGYDADGRGIGIDYPAGTADVGYTRDAAGNVVAMTDGLGTTEYSYDALNRLIARTRDGRTVGYTYDLLGRTSQIDYWGQGAVEYGYDDASRVASLTPWGAEPTSYTYRASGQLATQMRANSVATSYSYDGAGRLLGLLHAAGATEIQSIQYLLDANGNRTSMADRDGVTSYGYDALNRLTNVGYPAIPGGPGAASIPYSFDSAGNRTADGTTSYSYDAANRIASPGYSYDANGNLLSDGTASYEYDAADRLIKTVKGGVTTTYGYDGNGNLIRETSGDVTTDFVLDERGPLPTILGEVRSDGAELRYAYGPEGISAQHVISGTNTDLSYPLLDALGSLRQLTDAGGNVTLNRSYDAFGAIRKATGAGWTTLGFTGERTNPIDGTIYLRARHYSPALGRFLQRDSYAGDPVRPQSLNRYAYTENNPATWTDPSGMCVGFLWGSATCRPIWETGQGLNIEDGKKYWWSVAKSAVGLMVAPVDLAIGMITDPVHTLRGALLAPFQTFHDLYLGLVCDDMELLARGLVGAGAMAIGAAEALERVSASAVEDGRLSKAAVESDSTQRSYEQPPTFEESIGSSTEQSPISRPYKDFSLGNISVALGDENAITSARVNISNIGNTRISNINSDISLGNIDVSLGNKNVIIDSIINISCIANVYCRNGNTNVSIGNISVQLGDNNIIVNSTINITNIGNSKFHDAQYSITKGNINVQLGNGNIISNSNINISNIGNRRVVLTK